MGRSLSPLCVRVVDNRQWFSLFLILQPIFSCVFLRVISPFFYHFIFFLLFFFLFFFCFLKFPTRLIISHFFSFLCCHSSISFMNHVPGTSVVFMIQQQPGGWPPQSVETATRWSATSSITSVRSESDSNRRYSYRNPSDGSWIVPSLKDRGDRVDVDGRWLSDSITSATTRK